MAEKIPTKPNLPEKETPNKEDDMGKDLGPKLLFLAVGVVIGLILYCVIFDCSCDESDGCVINVNDPDGGTIVVEKDSGGTSITKDGVPQDCEWDCEPVPGGSNDGGDPGQPGGEPGKPGGKKDTNESCQTDQDCASLCSQYGPYDCVWGQCESDGYCSCIYTCVGHCCKDASICQYGVQQGYFTCDNDSEEDLPDFAMTDIGSSCDGDYDGGFYSNDKINSLRIWPQNKGPASAGPSTSLWNPGGRISIAVNGKIELTDLMQDWYPMCNELYDVTGMNCEMDLMQAYSSSFWDNVRHGDTVEVCLDYEDDYQEVSESNNCLEQEIYCPTSDGGGPEPEGCQGTYEATEVCEGECDVDGQPGICEITGPDECSCLPEENEPEPEPGPEYTNCQDEYSNTGTCSGTCILPDDSEGECYFDEQQESCYCAEIGYEPPEPEPEECAGMDEYCDSKDCCEGLVCCPDMQCKESCD